MFQFLRSEQPVASRRVEQRTFQRWWRPAVSFAVHVVVGSLLFALIAGFAGLLHLIVARLDSAAMVSPLLKPWLTYGEYAVFAVDGLLFGVFLIHESWEFIRSLDWQ